MLLSALLHKWHSAAALAAFMSCTAQQAPMVKVTFNNVPYTVNNTVTLDQLQSVRADTHFSKGPTENFTTVGTTQSHVEAGLDVGFQMLKNNVTDESCIWLQEVKIDVAYRPQVLIVRDYKPNSCRYQTTHEHELRHVNVDIISINDYMPIIRNIMQTAVNRIGTVGPVSVAEMQSQQQKMQQVLQTSLETVMNQLSSTRQARQQQVDTREEYLRLSKICPNEPAVTR